MLSLARPQRRQSAHLVGTLTTECASSILCDSLAQPTALDQHRHRRRGSEHFESRRAFDRVQKRVDRLPIRGNADQRRQIGVVARFEHQRDPGDPLRAAAGAPLRNPPEDAEVEAVAQPSDQPPYRYTSTSADAVRSSTSIGTRRYQSIMPDHRIDGQAVHLDAALAQKPLKRREQTIGIQCRGSSKGVWPYSGLTTSSVYLKYSLAPESPGLTPEA